MDTQLKCSLFTIIYLNVVFITSLFCVKRKTKNVTPEKVTDPPRRASLPLQPRKIELNLKECLIKDGLQTGKHAYPTLDDIKSDWGDKEEKEGDKNVSGDAGNVPKTVAPTAPTVTEERTKDDGTKDDEKKG